MVSRDRFCCVKNCYNSRITTSKRLSFFTFPREEVRCKQWLINTGRTDLLSKNSQQISTSHYLICGDHFRDDQFVNIKIRNRLIRHAVPTKFSTARTGSAILPYLKDHALQEDYTTPSPIGSDSDIELNQDDYENHSEDDDAHSICPDGNKQGDDQSDDVHVVEVLFTQDEEPKESSLSVISSPHIHLLRESKTYNKNNRTQHSGLPAFSPTKEKNNDDITLLRPKEKVQTDDKSDQIHIVEVTFAEDNEPKDSPSLRSSPSVPSKTKHHCQTRSSEVPVTWQIYNDIVRQPLPNGWGPFYSDGELNFVKVRQEVVCMSLRMTQSFQLSLTVLGESLPPGHQAIEIVSSYNSSSLEKILRLLKLLNRWNVCVGCGQDEHMEVFSIRFMQLRECCRLMWQTSSLHCTLCELLVPAEKLSHMCKKCCLLKTKLKKLARNIKRRAPKE